MEHDDLVLATLTALLKLKTVNSFDIAKPYCVFTEHWGSWQSVPCMCVEVHFALQAHWKQSVGQHKERF